MDHRDQGGHPLAALDSIAALRIADGYVVIDTMDGKESLFSEHYACPVCIFTVPELELPPLSFNAPLDSSRLKDGLLPEVPWISGAR